MIRNKIYVIGVSLIGAGCVFATTVKFDDQKEYPNGSALEANASWTAEQKEAFKIQEDGSLLLLDDAEAWSAAQYKESIATPNMGDAATVSIDFTYDQVKNKTDSEVIRVGLGNGSSRLMSTFNRKGWGDYDSIGMEGYAEGLVVFTPEIGFKTNASVGTSDPLRLSMTLTRAEGDSWNMVVVLENLTPGSDWSKRWEKNGLTFKSGSSDELFGIIQAGETDANAGIANRLVSRFEINNDPASPSPTKDWEGVDFKKYILPMEPQGPLVDKGIWGESVLPRDPLNGLEDQTMENWCYWDGSIV